MKVCILTTIMAPYRIDVFNELGKYCKLTVLFEQKEDSIRNQNWYGKEFLNFKSIRLKKWNKSTKTVKWDVIKYINEIKPDITIVYEYSTNTALLFMLICKMKKIPYCINCDGAILKRKNIKDWIKKFYVKHAIACLANGQSAKKYFLNLGAKEKDIYNHNFSSLYKKQILESVINIEEKEKLKKELNLNVRKVYISVGQFTYRKGFDILIEAIKKIKNNDNLFLIIGEGNELNRYKELIKKYKIKNIKFLNFMNKEKLLKYYDASDVFILPTREDIWGLVINEAMSRGLPVISTNKCMAAVELVENDKNGIIVKTDCISELKDAICKYEKKDRNTLLEEGRYSLRKIKKYNIEDIAISHINTLNTIMKTKDKVNY